MTTLPPANADIPPLGRRLLFGGLRLIPLLVLYVGLPVGLLGLLSSHHVSTGLSIPTITIAGVILAVLGAVRYVVKPTRAFGPVTVVASLGLVAYLLTLAPGATLTLSVQGGTFSLQYGIVLELLAIVPGLRALEGLVTTVEDGIHPGERLPFDFPRKKPLV